MPDTKGNLKPARIVKVNDTTLTPDESTYVKCMFNPYEYTLSKSNTFKEEETANGGNTPKAELTKAGAQTLKLTLIFDTYGKTSKSGESKDVSLETDKLWEFMRPTETAEKDETAKKHAPLVAFQWGVFFFISYITNMTQKFTLFTPAGMPVRAKVDITFTQYTDVVDRREQTWQNPTSGSGPIDRIHRVVAGERIDLIAHEVYGSATKWRHIAKYNNLVSPDQISPGDQLLIPYEQEIL